MTSGRAAGVTGADRGSPPRRPGRPANSSTDETVAAVLAAARQQFAAHGYAGTSNRTVAAAAGLAHTAIYNHFGSKARLFTAVFVDVQDLLIAELERSARAAPSEPPLPHALLDAIEALRAADPSYVEFLASMYVEVRRHPELRQVFQGGDPFPILDTLRQLAAEPAPPAPGADSESSTWLWIAFALGLAQLGALADPGTFAGTMELLRRGVATLRADGPSPSEGAAR
jgi:AcrR family transcriptional regulator